MSKTSNFNNSNSNNFNFNNNKIEIKRCERLFLASKNIERPVKTTHVPLKDVLEYLKSKNAFLEKEISFEIYNKSSCLNTYNRKQYNKNKR